jgi:hypothetical protein
VVRACAGRRRDDHFGRRRVCDRGREKLKAAGLSAEVDLRNEKINYKVREHSLAKVPVLLVCGRREAEEATVNIRRLGSRDQDRSLDAAVAALVDEATSAGRETTGGCCLERRHIAIDLLAGLDETQRIDRGAIFADFVVKMRAGRSAARSDQPHDIASLDLLAFADENLAHMGEPGCKTIAMVDLDHPAVAARAGFSHDAARRRLDLPIGARKSMPECSAGVPISGSVRTPKVLETDQFEPGLPRGT